MKLREVLGRVHVGRHREVERHARDALRVGGDDGARARVARLAPKVLFGGSPP